MSNHTHDLVQRRERLIAQCAAQRAALARDLATWRVPLARVDLGLDMLRRIRRHPVWIVGGLVLFAVFRPARVGTWLQRGWLAWRVVHSLRGKDRP